MRSLDEIASLFLYCKRSPKVRAAQYQATIKDKSYQVASYDKIVQKCAEMKSEFVAVEVLHRGRP